MKRCFLALLAVLTLMVTFAQLRQVLPASVLQFNDERAAIERRMSSNDRQAEDMPRTFAPTRMIDGVEYADAFIGFTGAAPETLLKAHGVRINCVFDDFLTAKIPVDQLEKVCNLPGVTDVEMSRLMEMCTDSTLSQTHAGQVLNGLDYGLPQAYDGSGVIIGIIDNGFDYQHRAFRKADDPNTTRIVRVYDPMDSTGHPLVIGNNTLSGSIFMGDQIDTLTTDCNESHGTHTTSIAAGAHVNGYGGMAPGAEIVLCSSRTLNLYMSETEVISCMKYIYSYADSVGKPCVISVSVSTTYGPHDGNDRVSKAIAQLVGPGRIFVIAAGNNASGRFYCSGPSTEKKQLNMLMGYVNKKIYTNSDMSFYYASMWFDNWVRAINVRPILAFHIFDKQTKRVVWESDLITLRGTIYSDEFSDYYEPETSVDSVGYLYALVSQTLSGKYEVTSHVYNLKSKSYTINSEGKYISRYQIGVTIYPPSLKYPRQPDSIYVDSWQCMSNGTRGLYTDVVYVDEVTEEGDTVTHAVEDFYARPSDDCSVGTYTINDSVISAGAYIGRNIYYSYNTGTYISDNNYIVGKYAPFSGYKTYSRGPKLGALPTAMAPGNCVVAAGSRYSYFATQPWNTTLVMKTSDGCLWGVMSGTSMAAPTVAGIIAQWLQIKPDLCPGDIKHIIAETAIKDSFTNDPDYYYRYGPNGKIDAMAGALYIIDKYLPHVMKGDVDADGVIGISDLSTLIDYLLGFLDEGVVIDLVAADVDNDGEVTIGDVSDLVDLLLAI